MTVLPLPLYQEPANEMNEQQTDNML